MTTWTDLPEERKRKIAVHESGHVVAALVMGVIVKRVSLPNDDHKRGAAVVLAYDDLDENLALTYAAGPAAEVLCYGEYRREGACDDKQKVREIETFLVDAGNGDYSRRGFERYVSDSRRMLESSRNAICLLADELLAQHTLTGDEVQAIAKRF